MDLSRIIVGGAGHGGVVAAMKLARAGHDVTVYEKRPYEDLGAEQYDAVDNRFFRYAGIDVPEHWKSEPNRITLVPVGDDPKPVTLPPIKNDEALIVDRKELIRFLIALAREAGVKFEFENGVKSAIVLGDRVAGIETERGAVYGDLIIDSCGAYSPIRLSLPEHMQIKKEPDKYDVLYTYRAYFARAEDAEAPETRYNIYLKNDGRVGFCWLICENDWCDVLIGRFDELRDDDILETLNMLYRENPHMDKTLLKSVSKYRIPVRQPLPIMVANGYAAIGDCAFMTSPLKGSGIGLSVMAAQMLADTVAADTDGFFNGKTLWNYQMRYFKEAGYDCCRMALAKSVLPFLTAEEVRDFLNSGIVTTEDLAALLENGAGSLFSKKGIAAAYEKLRAFGDHPTMRKKLTDILTGILRFAVLEPFMPNKYDPDDLEKWFRRYEDFFAAARRQD